MYAIETVTIPPKDLLLWKSLLIGVQGWTPYSNTWIKYILSYPFICIHFQDEEPLIVGSMRAPTSCKPLTRGKLETLAFLAMTGECNE